MRTESGQLGQDAFLCPCPHCSARNALNAPRCWHCEEELPPPSADALIAAYAALAAVRESRPATPVRLPAGWRVHRRPAPDHAASPDGTAAGGGAEKAAAAGPDAPATMRFDDPGSVAPRPDTRPSSFGPAGADDAPPGSAPALPPDAEPGPPLLRTIAMGDEDDDDAEPAAGHAALAHRVPRPDPVDEASQALARQAAISERFGAFVGRDEAASRRRHIFALAVAVLGTVLILAGYPIYRSAERSLGADDLRRTPPPPGWPQTPAVAPQRAPSPTPLMTRDEPFAPPVSRTASVPAADVDPAPLQPTPVQAGPDEHLGAAVPAHGLTGVTVPRAADPHRSHNPGAPHGAAATGASAAHATHVAHIHPIDRHKHLQPLVLPPATARELAALASGR